MRKFGGYNKQLKKLKWLYKISLLKKKTKYFLFVVILLLIIFLTILRERNTSKSHCDNEMVNQFVLSYSSFGKNFWESFGKNIEKVAKGALNSSLYSKWRGRIYHDLYPAEFLEEMRQRFQNIDFIDVRNLFLPFATDLKISSIHGMMWRFIPMGDSNVDIMCSRDLDSVIYPREEDAVRYWMSTCKTVHSMRGGMWCYRAQNDRTKGKSRLLLMLQKAKRGRNNQK